MRGFRHGYRSSRCAEANKSFENHKSEPSLGSIAGRSPTAARLLAWLAAVRARASMPILLGLEVAAAFGVASALRSGYGNALGLTVGEAASKVKNSEFSIWTTELDFATSLARSFVSETPSESGESSNAPSSSHEDGVRHDAGASTPVDKRSIDAVAPTSPVRVRMRVRSMRLPRLFAEPVFLDEAAGEGVLSGARMLEQLAHAVPRRFGDAGTPHRR
eukprot:6173595-Pleurochrysis_carterae.AAC.2